MALTRSSRSGPTSIRASSMTAGTRTGNAPSHAPKPWVGFRRTPNSRPAPPRWLPGTPSPMTEKPFQRRLMEIFAGFAEHADYNAGKVIDEIEKEGKLNNTLIFYIWGDNGSSSEGLNGTISEQLAQNGIPTKISQHIAALTNSVGLTYWAGPRPTTCTTLDGAGQAAPRIRAPNSWAPTSAARVNRWLLPGRHASSQIRRPGRSSTT